MTKLNFKNKWVLITGASSGLGYEIARQLAKKEKANLIVTARRTDRLKQLKKEIQSFGETRVEMMTVDLSQTEEVEKLIKDSVEIADIYAVINNAGVTYYGKTEIKHMDTFEQIIDVNLKAFIRISLGFLDWFEKKGEGAILNITSEAGLVPTPFQTVYSASKHAAQVFTEGLYMENRHSPVVISSFAPGGIATEMLTKSGLDKKHGLESPFNMRVEKAAQLAIKTFKRKKFISIPGGMNKLTHFLTRFLPRKIVASSSEKVYRP